jgi:biofilm protein TabA
MILDSLEKAEQYYDMHPLFEQAFAFLHTVDPATVEPGTYELDGRNLYVIISRSPGQPPAPGRLEAHRKYIDVQVPLAGAFPVGWRPLADCARVHTAYSPDNDAGLFDDAPEAKFPLSAGRFAIFFPDDAHAPEPSPEPLVKAVFKIIV